jgi:hypothetical protein
MQRRHVLAPISLALSAVFFLVLTSSARAKDPGLDDSSLSQKLLDVSTAAKERARALWEQTVTDENVAAAKEAMHDVAVRVEGAAEVVSGAVKVAKDAIYSAASRARGAEGKLADTVYRRGGQPTEVQDEEVCGEEEGRCERTKKTVLDDANRVVSDEEVEDVER